ncbi:MAG: FtsX-like permease family protein [Sumerlaeia bacterium]
MIGIHDFASLRQGIKILIWRYITHEKLRSVLTLMGIALGVAILVAIDLTSQSAVSEFRNTVDQVAGKAQITVRPNGADLDPNLVSVLQQHPLVENASPLIQGYISVPQKNSARQIEVLVLGVDLLSGSSSNDDAGIRDINIILAEGTNFTELLTKNGYVLSTEKLLSRLGVQLGEQTSTSEALPLYFAGSIESLELNRVKDGEVLVCDLAVADVLLNAGGALSQIDVLPIADASIDEVIQSLKETLPGTALVETPQNRGERVSSMIDALRFNLMSLGHISLLVGAFLIYNTMSISVLRRRNVIGTLRAMGIRKSQIRFIFILEGLLFGLIGGVVGLLLGTILASLLLSSVSQTISISFFDARAQSLILSPVAYITALALGLIFSLFAALQPAHEAAATPPANTILAGSQTRSLRSLAVLFVLGLFTFALGFSILQLPLRPGIPYVGYVASAVFILGFVLLTQPMLALTLAVLRPVLSRTIGASGMLACAGLQGSLGRSGVAISGLLISVGMCVSVSVMVSSFRETVVIWMNQVLQADVYVIARDNAQGTKLARDLESELLAFSEIESIDALQSREFVFQDFPAKISGIDYNTDRWGQTLKEVQSVEALTTALQQNNVLVSEAFARRHQLTIGREIYLPTQTGNEQVTIAGIYTDYSSPQGYVLLSRNHFERLYGDSDFESMSIHLVEGADETLVRQKIADHFASKPNLPAINVNLSGQLRDFALEQFDRTFAITFALQIIAVVVAILGIITTLLAQIIDRKNDLITLRTIGASAKRVGLLVITESGLIAVTGIILGIFAGLILSYILTTVVMLQSFGWTISFRINFVVLIQIALIIFTAVLVGSIIPARKAAQLENS